MISQTLTRTEVPPEIAAPIILPLFMPSGKPYWYIPTDRIAIPGALLSLPFSPSAIAQEAYYSSVLDGAVEFSNHTQQALLAALQSQQVAVLQSTQVAALHSTQVAGLQSQQVGIHQSPQAFTLQSTQASALQSPQASALQSPQASALQSPQASSHQSTQASAHQRPQVSAHQSPQAPIDAAFVETVTSLLSGARTGFRATEIPGTPPPSAISWHMEQLYRFIPDERYHPLVKSAVCHSFILAVQPYYNCSGRLARLLAMLILIRSGYNFLLNASYSAVIAQRCNDYAQAFHSIFISNNPYGQAGNQTGFVEFIYDVLAEALETARRESAVRPPVVATTVEDKPNITIRSEKEDNRSKSLLVRCTDASEIVEDKPGITICSGKEDNRSKSLLVRRTAASEIVEDKPDITIRCGREDNHGRGIDDFEDKLAKLDGNKSPLVRRTAAVVREMLCSNIYEFTRSVWIDRTGMNKKEFDACRDTLKRYHLVRSIGRTTSNGRSRVVYRFTKENTSDDEEDEQGTQLDKLVSKSQQLDVIQPSDSVEQTAFGKSPAAVDQAWVLPILTEMENSRFETVRNTAAIYRSFLQRGSTEFTTDEWVAQTGQSSREFHKSYEILAKRHLIDCVERSRDHIGRYRLTPKYEALLSPSIFWTRLEALENSKSANVRKGAAAVRKMIEEGYAGFTSQQWKKKTGMLLIEFATFRNRLFENQLIINVNRGTAIREAYYRFTLNGDNNFTDAQCTHAKHDDRIEGSDVAEQMEGSDVVREETHSEDFIRHLNELTFSRSKVVKRGAVVIRAMISEGTMSFSRKEWMKRANMTKEEYATCYSAMSSRGMIRKLPKESDQQTIYAFNCPVGAVLPEPNAPEIQNRYIKVNRYIPIFNQLAPLVPIEDFPKKALAAMTGTTHHITESEWAAVNHLSPEEASRDVNILYYMGIVTRRYYKRFNAFSYHLLRPEKLEQMLEDGVIKPPENFDYLPFWASLSNMAGMKSSITRQAADTVREMIDAGVFYFTPGSWFRRTGMDKNQFGACIAVMRNHRMAVVDGSVYRLTIVPQGTPVDYCELLGIEKKLSKAHINRIKKFASCAKKDYDKRIGAFLLGMIKNGSRYFTMKEYAQGSSHSVTTLKKDMHRAQRLGLIRRLFEFGTAVYVLTPGLGGQAFPDPFYDGSVNIEKRDYRPALTPFRKRRLTEIYQVFSVSEFTRAEYVDVFHTIDARHTLNPLVGLKMITERRSQGRYLYRLAVTPEERPECFEKTLFPSQQHD